ncbi:hypothetical protein [Pseudomonas sp. H3(2019)]|uniref:hypothetical protein n=1 Tax=Pseudomonas sp. H3(2019) TaxID=2598724 RepID=UPI0011976F4F|nr:hypothetical protein [Pseudomonas sp. H3(2019)]TVT80380.1 hypothetical protein FPT12_23590 [Pseudomonas sp. H3(2019)]
MELDAEQLHALVLGLPWQRVGRWQRDFHRLTPAMTTQAVQLSDEPIVGLGRQREARLHAGRVHR